MVQNTRTFLAFITTENAYICSKLLMNWQTIFVIYAIANSISLYYFFIPIHQFLPTKPGSLKGRF